MTPSPPQSLPAARLAEAYEVLEVVRRGSLSTTFRARHRGSGDLRCIDVLRAAPGEREALERRLDSEARPLMELRHPNVARLVDAAVGDAGEACLVRENHDGVTLRRLTASQRPSVSLAVELLRQAADALAFFHDRGRKVGDLSPEGLLVGRAADGSPQVVVADLGLAKDWQEEAALTAAGLFIGRLRYAAPEQFDAAGRKGPLGDVYALGLVAYELLTGRHPIAGDTASSLIAGHLFRPPTEFGESDPEGEVPDALRQIVLSALAKKPDERPTAETLRNELAACQIGLPAVDPSEIDRWVGPRRQSETDAGSADAEVTPEEQLEGWLEEAHALARDEQFIEARDKVRQVLKVQPDHSMGLMLLASLEACLKIQVEESRAHETLVASPEADAAPTEDIRETLVGGTATVQLPVIGGDPALGTETVRVTSEDLLKMAAEASGADGPGDEPGGEESVDDSIDDSMATQRLDSISQIPGGPASTERLDLDGDPSTRIQAMLDDDKTRPLTPEVLRQAAERQPPATQPHATQPPATVEPAPSPPESPPFQPAAPPSSPPPAAQTPQPPPSAMGDGTTQLLNEELPGTVTMPLEQIEAQKRRALDGSSPSSGAVPPSDRPMDAVADGSGAIDDSLDDDSLDDTVSPEVTVPVRTKPQPPAGPPSGPQSEPQSGPPLSEPKAGSSWGVISEPTQAQPAQSEPTQPEPTHFGPQVPAKTTRADPPPAEPKTPPEPTPASVDQLGFGGAATAPTYEPRETRRRGKSGRGRGRRGRGRGFRRGAGRRGAPESKSGGTWILIGAAVAAVLVFAFGYAVSSGVDLRKLVGLDEAEQIVPPSELPPVAAEPGRLLLDAAPWAEIVQITDSLGEDVPLRFRHTPARYELVPGAYTVVMAGPDGQNQTLEVEVLSEQDVEARPVFEEMSVDDYFRRMGWR